MSWRAAVTTSEEPSSPYLRALGTASELGRADGRLAVGFEPGGEPAPLGSWCHGLAPEDLAQLVWDAGAGPAPAGLVLNAPLWYAQGFREALACARAQESAVPCPRDGVVTGPDEPVRTTVRTPTPPAARRASSTGGPADGGGGGMPGPPGPRTGTAAAGTTVPVAGAGVPRTGAR